MKIDNIWHRESFEIEVSDDDHEYYNRYSPEVWTFRIGDVEEPVLDDEKVKELEAEFQKFLINLKKSC